VVLFHVGPVYTWESQSTRDYTLFYGVKNGDVIDIYSAVIGADPDTGVKIKGWAFKIHIEGQTWFEVRHNSNVYTFSSAGAPDADFILRCRESPIVFSGGDYVVLYNYADGLYDVEDEFAPASYGDPLNESDLTKPAAVSNETWTRIITFGSTIYNPDDIVAPPCPADITSFNNTFLSGAF
jgi:hypothetical protein